MINWDLIDTVMLDMDGTLLDLHFDNYFWLDHLPLRYAQIHNVDLAAAHQKLNSDIRKHEGTLQWYCLEFWSKALDVDISRSAPMLANFCSDCARAAKKYYWSPMRTRKVYRSKYKSPKSINGWM